MNVSHVWHFPELGLGLFQDPHHHGLSQVPGPELLAASPPPCSLALVRPDGQSWATGSRVYPREPPNLNSLVSVSGTAGDQREGFV